jgi:tRNA G18 (ribose-2'-O)-methylase SpoU
MTTPTDTTTTNNDAKRPRLYLIICNIQKLNNVRALMLTATAFGCQEVILVGQGRNTQQEGFLPKDFEVAQEQGMIQLTQLPKWRDCLEYLQQENIYVIGVEIDERSQVLDDDYVLPNVDRMAIFMGNEGQGIHPTHLEACQALIRIPQYGVGTASLNVNVAASVVFHRFHHLLLKKKSG